MNNKIKKVAFYGNEVTGPYEDVIRGKKKSYGYVVYEDGTVEEIKNNFELLNERVAQARAENVVPLSYENDEKVQIHCEYEKQGVPLTNTDPILDDDSAKTGTNTRSGAYVDPAATAAFAGAAAGYAASQANDDYNRNPYRDIEDGPREKKDGSFAKKAICVGIAGAIGLGAGYLLWGKDKAPEDTKAAIVIDNDVNYSNEQQLAQYRLQEHFKLTDEQATTLQKLETGLEAMTNRCNELGIPEAAFNTDEALVFSLMMSDVSNEEAARYCQTLGYTAEDMDTIYKSAVEKFIVIQSVVNSEDDIHMFDNFIIKTNGQSDRLSKEENEQKLQRVLDALHGSLKYNILVNTAKEENIDKEKGTIKLEDGRVISYQDIIDYDFALIKAKETKDLDGNTVYGFASNSSVVKVFMDAYMMSNFYHTTGMDSVIIGDTYNVDGDEIKANVAKEYDELNQDACDNTIDFEEVARLIKESNDALLKDVLLVTGQADIRGYREANFPNSYDSQIEKLQEKYNNKMWNELDEEVRNKLWSKITDVNNKLRYVATGSLYAGGVGYRTETTTTTWTEAANDLISETREGTGVTREEAEKELEKIYDDKKEEYEEKAEDEGGKLTETDDGFTYSDTNEDGSGTYAEVTKDDDSVNSTEIEADKPVITTPTVDDKGYVENPVEGGYDQFDTTKAEDNYTNPDYNPEVTQQIVQEQQSQPTYEEVQQEAVQINEEYQAEGEDWEQYFEELESGSNVSVDEGEYEDVTDHGPVEYIRGNQP